MLVLDHQHCSPFSREERDWRCQITLPAALTCKNIREREREREKERERERERERKHEQAKVAGVK